MGGRKVLAADEPQETANEAKTTRLDAPAQAHSARDFKGKQYDYRTKVLGFVTAIVALIAGVLVVLR
jgi:hypothetical protein